MMSLFCFFLSVSFAATSPQSEIIKFLDRQAKQPAADFLVSWKSRTGHAVKGEWLASKPMVFIYDRSIGQQNNISLGSAIARTEDNTGIFVQRASDDLTLLYPARDIAFATKKYAPGSYIHDNRRVYLSETFVHPQTKKRMWLLEDRSFVEQPEIVETVLIAGSQNISDKDEPTELDLVQFLDKKSLEGHLYPDVYENKHKKLTDSIKRYNRALARVPVMVIERIPQQKTDGRKIVFDMSKSKKENQMVGVERLPTRETSVFPGLYVGSNKDGSIVFVSRTDRPTINMNEFLAYPRSEVVNLDLEPAVLPGDYVIYLNYLYVEALVIGTFTNPLTRMTRVLIETNLYNESASPQQRLVPTLNNFKLTPISNSPLLTHNITIVTNNVQEQLPHIEQSEIEKVYPGFIMDSRDKVWPLHDGPGKSIFGSFAFVTQESDILKIALFEDEELIEKSVASVSAGGLIVTDDRRLYELNEVFVVEKEDVYRDSYGQKFSRAQLLQKMALTRSQKIAKGFDTCRIALGRLAKAMKEDQGEDDRPRLGLRESVKPNLDRDIGTSWDNHRSISFLERIAGKVVKRSK